MSRRQIEAFIAGIEALDLRQLFSLLRVVWLLIGQKIEAGER